MRVRPSACAPAAPIDSATLRGRFEREVRITARLQHPAIVPVYEAGRLGDEPFEVVES